MCRDINYNIYFGVLACFGLLLSRILVLRRRLCLFLDGRSAESHFECVDGMSITVNFHLFQQLNVGVDSVQFSHVCLCVPDFVVRLLQCLQALAIYAKNKRLAVLGQERATKEQ